MVKIRCRIFLLSSKLKTKPKCNVIWVYHNSDPPRIIKNPPRIIWSCQKLQQKRSQWQLLKVRMVWDHLDRGPFKMWWRIRDAEVQIDGRRNPKLIFTSEREVICARLVSLKTANSRLMHIFSHRRDGISRKHSSPGTRNVLLIFVPHCTKPYKSPLLQSSTRCALVKLSCIICYVRAG